MECFCPVARHRAAMMAPPRILLVPSPAAEVKTSYPKLHTQSMCVWVWGGEYVCELSAGRRALT